MTATGKVRQLGGRQISRDLGEAWYPAQHFARASFAKDGDGIPRSVIPRPIFF
jgi:hypothetical protein